MQYIFFSKLVKEQGVGQLIETLKTLAVEGVDLCVRDGYPVNPRNVRDELPKAAKRIRAAGMAIPMVSAATNLTNPASPEAESIFAACHDAGIRDVKVGYWTFKKDYWKQVDSARKDIEGFDRLASRYGIRANLHTHSGSNLGLNVSSIMDLARGFDPARVGVYLDPGHLALCGESPAMSIDIAGDHLSLVAIKDSIWLKGEGADPRKSRFLPLGQGFVDWRDWMRALMARDYTGPISFHSEFESPSTAFLIDQTRRDVQFLRGIEAEVRKG